MTDQDWSDLIKHADIDVLCYRQPTHQQFCVRLDLEVFAYRYAQKYLVRKMTSLPTCTAISKNI
jgi:hypothetical protein